MKRYLLIVAILALSLCLGVALFNYRVDPYGLYRPGVASVDRLSRIEQFYHLRMSKPWLLLHAKPSAVVLGTSRSSTLPPRHPTWPEGDGYNLSVPGLTLYEMLRFLQHAQSVRPLDHLVLGLDFAAFVRPEPRSRVGFEEARLARSADDLSSPRFAWRYLDDARVTVFSLTGFSRSVSALFPTTPQVRRYLVDGTWESTGLSASGIGGFIQIGKGAVADLRDEQLDLDSNMALFADILRFAHRHKITTRLFVTPEHIFMVDLWWRMGHEALWREFHHRLVQVNDDVARELGVAAFPLYGFNQVQGVADEPIRKQKYAAKSLFSDGLHFRPALGRRIMDALWSEHGGAGMRLDSQSVDAYIAEVDHLRQGFLADNAELAASVRRAIAPSLENF